MATKKQKKKIVVWQVGKCYLISTVTTYELGRLIAVTDTELVLEDASWVAYTGRFGEALEKGKVDEAEPYPDGQVIVGRGAVVTAVEWQHPLIRKAV